jgi:transposase
METIYYGIDLHSTQITNHLIKKGGGKTIERENEKIYINEIGLKLLPKLTKNTHVCLEASGCSFKFAEMIKEYVKEVYVINPIDFKALYCTGKKLDKIDAKKLANRLKYYIESEDKDEDFPLVYIPQPHVIKLRKLFSGYKLVMRNAVSIKNRIHSILKSNMISYKREYLFKAVAVQMNNNELDEVDKFQIELLMEDIETMKKQINKIKYKILETGYKHFEDEIKILMSIKGVSDFIACANMADIGDIARFANAKKLSSYLRSTPKDDSSNNTTKIGKRNKKGRKLSFKLIIQGLNHIIKSTPKFQRFYEVKSKGKNKNTVRSAIVRKTIVAIFFMLRNKEIYKDCDMKSYELKLSNFEKKKKIFSKGT